MQHNELSGCKNFAELSSVTQRGSNVALFCKNIVFFRKIGFGGI
jgi:hypothetical protein